MVSEDGGEEGKVGGEGGGEAVGEEEEEEGVEEEGDEEDLAAVGRGGGVLVEDVDVGGWEGGEKGL